MRNLKAIGRHLRSLRSSALVIALLGITLVTILTLTLFLISRYERKSANLALGKATSESLADLGADLAITHIREATDDGLSAGKMWISEPGRIRVYSRADLNTSTDYNLFSALPGPDTSLRDENNVDLNRRSLDGKYPIAAPEPGKSKATMKVGWINLPANPGAPAASTNQIAGRIAFWVDDETCKVNINTADGSHKEDLYRIIGASESSKSFGFGTPGEISLEALTESDGTHIANTTATAISDYAWEKGFNSASEISRVSGVSSAFFENNKFNITHYSKTPELTFFGEPRIYLVPVVPLSTGLVRTLLNGAYGNSGSEIVAKTDPIRKSVSAPIDFIYPISHPTLAAYNQFPQAIPSNPTIASYGSNSSSTSNANNLSYIKRIASAISGKDSAGQPVQWPAFNSVTSGFSDKYSVRQIDSIALQIHDISNTNVFPDQNRGHSLPSIAFNGIINTDTSQSRAVSGLGRYLKLTEIYIQTSSSPGTIKGTDFPYLRMRTDLEFYLPEFYAGSPIHEPYAGTSATQFRLQNLQGGVGTLNQGGPNQVDMVRSGTTSWLGGYWCDNLLQILQQEDPAKTDLHSGIDMMGNDRLLPDPDQTKAKEYHPYLFDDLNGNGVWDKTPTPEPFFGSVLSTSASPRLWSPLEISAPQLPDQAAYPGTYFSQPNRYKDAMLFPARPGLSQFRFRGGLSVWDRTGTSDSGWIQWEPVPLDGLRGPYTSESAGTVLAQLTQAIIPVDFNLDLDSPNGAGAINYLVQVADPLVNKFPGDWKNTPPAQVTMALNSDGNSNSWIYKKGGANSVDRAAFPSPTDISLPTPRQLNLRSYDGDNSLYRPSNGGDPLSVWLPRQDIRYPKQSRFPSVGALNYVRTGIIPDDLSVSIRNQAGTPWRSINLSASTSTSQTVHGKSYPDWAMLDLFTVPYLPQKPYVTGTFGTPPQPQALQDIETPVRKLTYGGATEGKLNINNPRVPYPFDQNPAINTDPPIRKTPLEAIFYNIRPSSYSGDDPLIATSPKVDHAAIAQDIQNYLNSTDGSGKRNRFLLPGQLADIPAIDFYTYSGVSAPARSRNDLMKQIVGATCTQSNVFSVWIVAQTIKKSPKNTDPSKFEPGDSITGETRRRYIVERHLDYGLDGVPGNANNPGADGYVGTEDDPIDANYHPKMTFPLKYRWRIVAVETSES